MMMGGLIFRLPWLSKVLSLDFTAGLVSLPRQERNCPKDRTFFRVLVPKKLDFDFFWWRLEITF